MSPTPSSLVDEDHVRPEVDAALERHLAELRGELAPYGSDTEPLADAMTAMLSGGKRLRAAFCYWSWRAHGGDSRAGAAGRRTVLRVGAALELFQAAALFHDDVMDDSDLRRGRPAAHRHFEAHHRAAGWSGHARRFGDSAAILLGDLALIASEREMTGAVGGVDPATAVRARSIFDTMRTEVTVGQYLDVLGQALPWGVDLDADEERARRVVRAKSARYSVEHPLALGAALAGAGTAELEACSRVGLPLGEAFQLRDDILGVFGDPAVTGKPAGDDLREGKRTVLVTKALRSASPADRALVADRLGAQDLSRADVEALRGLLLRSGAVEQVETLISALADDALDALSGCDLADPGREMLLRLGRAAVERRS